MEYMKQLNPILLAFLATSFTYLATMLGSALVFIFKSVNRKILDILLGFGAGVMIAGSFWSLLTPSIEICSTMPFLAWFIPSSGFMLGGLFIILSDKLLSNYDFTKTLKNNSLIKNNTQKNNTDGIKRSILLILAIVMHNIPEGIALGVAFGGVSAFMSNNDLLGVIALAFGIALQNFPEGATVAVQMRREGFSRKKAFIFGQMSGAVEPLAGTIGAILALKISGILPFFLSFSAGAMIAVVSLELIPEASRIHKQLGTLGVTFGFILIMLMEIIF